MQLVLTWATSQGFSCKCLLYFSTDIISFYISKISEKSINDELDSATKFKCLKFSATQNCEMEDKIKNTGEIRKKMLWSAKNAFETFKKGKYIKQ